MNLKILPSNQLIYLNQHLLNPMYLLFTFSYSSSVFSDPMSKNVAKNILTSEKSFNKNAILHDFTIVLNCCNTFPSSIKKDQENKNTEPTFDDFCDNKNFKYNDCNDSSTDISSKYSDDDTNSIDNFSDEEANFITISSKVNHIKNKITNCISKEASTSIVKNVVHIFDAKRFSNFSKNN